jgi:hydrogenase expression/formation protein HypD
MVKSQGGVVRVVYSPLDAVKIARENPDKKVVFFAVGFETTAPNNAMAVWQAQREGLKNFSILVSHVLVPPAMKALLSSRQNRVQGYLAAGHVCTVMGWEEYEPIAAQYRVPIVVTGFEPVDILEGILMVVQQLERGEARVENQYTRVVRREGNRPAQELIRRVFEVSDRKWRGLGEIAASGLRLRPEFRDYDAEAIFNLGELHVQEPAECISGLVLQGLKKPNECPAFGNRCTPQTPLGATMVSSEGACAAYYAYHRHGGKG